MRYKIDINKDKTNREKHGVGLMTGKKLIEDGNSVHLQSDRNGEPRTCSIGVMFERLWSAISSPRGLNETRIISVHRSTKKEKRVYNEQRGTSY
jgi:uncharacterized DUF497 family protein